MEKKLYTGAKALYINGNPVDYWQIGGECWSATVPQCRFDSCRGL